MAFIWVFIGGGIGSMLRYGISRVVPYAGGFPIATFMANLISSFILGYLLAQAFRNNLSQEYRWLLMSGLCGGFSTFSTFSAENFQLMEEGAYKLMIFYVICSVVLGIAAIFAGYFLGRGGQ